MAAPLIDENCMRVDGHETNDFTSPEQLKWQALAITHVEYPEGDLFGKLLAISSLLPLVIIVGFSTLVVFRRDLHTITFLFGLSCNEIINWILKRVIREYRPFREREVLYSEYGMPSSHAQFMWFFAAYITFFILLRIHHISNGSLLDNAWKYLVTAGVFWTALAVSYGRVYLQYHTTMQVICGALVGVSLATAWFALTQLVFTPLFPFVAAWKISEFLMIRDSTLIPNVMWFEYTCHRSEMRTRHRKLVSMRSQ